MSGNDNTGGTPSPYVLDNRECYAIDPLGIATVQMNANAQALGPLVGTFTGEYVDGVPVYRLPGVNVSVSRKAELARMERDGVVTWLWLAGGVAFRPRWDLVFTADVQWTQWSKVDEIEKSGRMYVAMRNLMDQYQSKAITMDCLGALGHTSVSLPCIAWSRMLDDGIPAACEADLGACIKSAARIMMFPSFEGEPMKVEVPLTLGWAGWGADL